MSDTNREIIENKNCTVKSTVSNGIKVTVHIPDKVTESVKLQKINRIYELLKPQASH